MVKKWIFSYKHEKSLPPFPKNRLSLLDDENGKEIVDMLFSYELQKDFSYRKRNDFRLDILMEGNFFIGFEVDRVFQ